MTHSTPDLTSFDNDPQVEQLNRDMHAAGEQVEEVKIVNYFGTPEAFRFELASGQYFEYTPMTEGKKAAYERATNKDIRVQRTTGDAKMQVDPATERHAMIMLSVTDAHLLAPSKVTGSLQPLKFEAAKNGQVVNEFWKKIFEAFPPKIIQELYRKIRDANEWTKADEDIEAMEKEYVALGERIEAAKEREAKN